MNILRQRAFVLSGSRIFGRVTTSWLPGVVVLASSHNPRDDRTPGVTTLNNSKTSGFTIIELLVVLAIIALLSTMVFAAQSSSKQRARDAKRIAAARSLKTALALFEDKNGSILGINAGNGGDMMSVSATTSKSIIDLLVQNGFLTRKIAGDSVFGTSVYYLGICGDGRYDVYSKLERIESAQSSSTLGARCDGGGALAAGFNYGTGMGGGAGSGGGVVAGGGGGGGSATTTPSSFSITQSANSRLLTASWVAGSGNGGVGGCRLQYQSDASWVTVASPATVDCDATQSNLSVALPAGTLTGVSANWNSRKLRIVRVSDSVGVATSSNALACSVIAGSSGATPNTDEDCDGQWDNSSSLGGDCNTCSVTAWSYSVDDLHYDNTSACSGALNGSTAYGFVSYGEFPTSAACNADKASRFPGGCYSAGCSPTCTMHRYSAGSCTSSSGTITSCGLCGSTPVVTTYY